MHVIVVGAGIVGLASAVNLAARGARVTVLDREPVGGADLAHRASWGNAGWVSPGLVVPLAEPGAWKHGITAFTDRDAPLSIPRLTPRLAVFLARFASQMTERRFHQAIDAAASWTTQALAAYDRLAERGVREPIVRAPFTIGTTSEDDLAAFAHEVEVLAATGVDVAASRVDAGKPWFSGRVTHALELTGQAYMDPGAYCADLVRLARELGVEFHGGVEVVTGHEGTKTVGLVDSTGATWNADRVLVAAGAWSDDLVARIWGRRARTGQASGRGYSFTVPVEESHMPPGPVYLPAQRVVLTPYRGGMRVAGTMEFADPDAPLDPRRIEGIVRTLEPCVEGLDLHARTDEWVGARPVPTDGRPALRRVGGRGYLCSGMGMWGIVLGAVAGERTADLVLR
ncbi:NAD(P)/FAD-dependent oxidoreductase [Brevibacterium litoralis]|uniref:NAD(P)/FAD-dependent oxidoreductase n=1 Tax=Brevibacterium litoralis TaxID=3138935 RepID=UPI0032EEF7CA